MTKEAEDIVEKWGVIKQMREAEAQMIKKMSDMQRKVERKKATPKAKKDKK